MSEFEDFRIGILGDSSCLDDNSVSYDCLWVLRILMEFASYKQVEIDENFRLPYDYDIHVEEEKNEATGKEIQLGQQRSENLQCIKMVEADVDDFEPSTHELSSKKLRIWAPLREFEPFDIVGIVQVATFLIVIILFGILFFTRYKVRNPGRLREIV